MLIHQAALSFEVWTGIKPDTKITKAELFDE
jgi:shikimate 5-dehydrogenase